MSGRFFTKDDHLKEIAFIRGYSSKTTAEVPNWRISRRKIEDCISIEEAFKKGLEYAEWLKETGQLVNVLDVSDF